MLVKYSDCRPGAHEAEYQTSPFSDASPKVSSGKSPKIDAYLREDTEWSLML